MPELPEVETVVRDLKRRILGKRIMRVWCDAPSILRNTTRDQFAREVEGGAIDKVARRGKHILLYLTTPRGKKLLVIHQKMTGHLLIGRWSIPRKSKEVPYAIRARALQEKVNQYIHLIFVFEDGEMLALSDARKFAKVLVGSVSEIELSSHLARLGPEPLELRSPRELKERLRARRGRMKSLLLNQEFIAGIGNIYADEILWRAKIHPLRRAEDLSDKEIENIFHVMRGVLERAIALRGTSMRDFRDTRGEKGGYLRELLVYSKEGRPCATCDAQIRRIMIGGRSAHFCPTCQRTPRKLMRT